MLPKELRDQRASIVGEPGLPSGQPGPTTILQFKCVYCLNDLNTSSLLNKFMISRGKKQR